MDDDKTGELLQQRAAHWGDPVLTHARIAEVWSGILDHEVTPHQVALCMVGLKLVRAAINPDDADSLEDAAGYVRIGQLILDGAAAHAFELAMAKADEPARPFVRLTSSDDI